MIPNAYMLERRPKAMRSETKKRKKKMTRMMKRKKDRKAATKRKKWSLQKQFADQGSGQKRDKACVKKEEKTTSSSNVTWRLKRGKALFLYRGQTPSELSANENNPAHHPNRHHPNRHPHLLWYPTPWERSEHISSLWNPLHFGQIRTANDDGEPIDVANKNDKNEGMKDSRVFPGQNEWSLSSITIEIGWHCQWIELAQQQRLKERGASKNRTTKIGLGSDNNKIIRLMQTTSEIWNGVFSYKHIKNRSSKAQKPNIIQT